MARKPPTQPSPENEAFAHFTRVDAEGQPDHAVEIDPADEAPEPEREHAVPLSEMFLAKYAETYDREEAVRLCRRLFPAGTISVLERLTGVASRLAARWSKGESRLPPPLYARMQIQDAKRHAFKMEMRALIERHVADGTLPEIIRQSMIRELEKPIFKTDQTL